MDFLQSLYPLLVVANARLQGLHLLKENLLEIVLYFFNFHLQEEVSLLELLDHEILPAHNSL